MPVPESAEALVAKRLKDVLTEWCITGVDADDASRADHVILGKATTERADEIVVSILTQHPLGLSQGKDSRVDGPPIGDDERPNRYPAESVGGMSTTMMVGAVQVNIRERDDYEDVISIIGALAARIKAAINRDDRLTDIKDDFGNYVSEVETFEAQGSQSGGSNITIDNRWVSWRAWVHTRNGRI